MLIDHNQKLEYHKRMLPLIRFLYHISTCGVDPDFKQFKYMHSDYTISLDIDEHEFNLYIKIDGKNDAICLSIKRQKQFYNGNYITFLHRDNQERVKLYNYRTDDFVKLTIVGQGTRCDNIPLYSTEEELFQISTLREVPEMSELQEIKEVLDLYNFIPFGVYYHVSFLVLPEFLDPKFMDPIEKKVWGIINTL